MTAKEKRVEMTASRTIYYTTDAEYDTIDQGADISTASDFDTLTAELNAGADGTKIIGWEEGCYGDCWVKLHAEPELDGDGQAEIAGIKCHVAAPGTHPGGKAWWLTPVEPVMVPVWTEDAN